LLARSCRTADCRRIHQFSGLLKQDDSRSIQSLTEISLQGLQKETSFITFAILLDNCVILAHVIRTHFLQACKHRLYLMLMAV
jgi:hypothetical protein